MECGSGSHRQDQGRYSWVAEDEISSVVWTVGVWDAPFQWKDESIPFHMQFKGVWKGEEHLTTVSGWLPHHCMGRLTNATRPQKWRPGVRLSFLLELPKEMLRNWGVPGEGQGFSLAKCCSTSGCPFGDSGSGDVFIPIPRLLFLGRSAAPGRQRHHSFPTHCVCFDLVKSTLSKAKLFGKKIKPDSLTNWKWGKSSVTVSTGCALYCILLFSKLNHSFLCVYIYR